MRTHLEAGGLSPGSDRSTRWVEVYEGVRRQILTLSLRPGASLSEVGLARQFGVSATPVRDALSRLSQEGFVTLVSRRGYQVASLSLQDISDLSQLRYVLESGVIRILVDREPPADLASLQRLLETTASADQSDDALIRANAEFHVRLASLVGSKSLSAAVGRVMDASTRVFYSGVATFRDGAMGEVHGKIVDAIAAKDLVTALSLCASEAYGTSHRVAESVLRAPRMHSSSTPGS